MKRSYPLICLLAAMLLVTSCSTKFNIAASYKSITVVYALLDMADTAHYIRIEKAFLDNNKNVQEMSQNPDSLYFPVTQLVVKMEQVALTPDSTIVNSYTLSRVDLAAEGYPKESGAFTTTNYAYKFKATLNAQYLYRLVIKNLATGEVDSAETPVINDLNHTVFNVPLFDIPTQLQGGLRFPSSTIVGTFTLEGGYTPGASEYSNTVALFQATMTFRWVDSSTGGGGSVEDTAQYDLAALGVANPSSPQFIYTLQDLSLQQFLAGSMGTAAPGHVRLLDSCDIRVYAATPDFNTYQEAGISAATGLTAGTIEPVYTNFHGTNALGLFTSRGYRYARVPINGLTIDSLEVNPIFANVNLVGSVH